MTTERRKQLNQVQEQLNAMSYIEERPEGIGDQLWRRQDQIIQLLQTITDGFLETFDTKRAEQIQLGQQVAALEAKLDHIQLDVNTLCKLVRDGNGQPSIIQRLSNIETKVHNQARELEQITQHANSITASRMLTKSQLVVGISGMVFTALLSFMALIATLLKP